jgi:SAM-dependent methyltransferase
MSEGPQHVLARAAEGFFEEHGDNFRGVGWTKSQADTDLRYQVMLGLAKRESDGPVDLLDFGCGLAHLYEYIQRNPPDPPVRYSGLDVSSKLLAVARQKFPELNFYEHDVLAGIEDLPRFDYVVLNGVFTYRLDISYERMLAYWQNLLLQVFPLARKGLAFNVMSTAVDWERDDLFHLPIEVVTAFVTERLSRRFVIRHDYPLYEYTTYVYREDRASASAT